MKALGYLFLAMYIAGMVAAWIKAGKEINGGKRKKR